MLGVEIAHCNAALEAVLTAYSAFLESTVESKQSSRVIGRYPSRKSMGNSSGKSVWVSIN